MSDAPVLLIAALNERGYIGKGGSKLYSGLPEDAANFHALTRGEIVIMGRKTFEGMGNRPLPGRFNIVLSKNKTGTFINDFREVLGRYESSLASAIYYAHDFCKSTENKASKIYIIGGGQVYKEAMKYATGAVLTHIEDDKDGDAEFPLGPFVKDFEEVGEPVYSGSDGGYEIEISTYRRNNYSNEAFALLWERQGVRADNSLPTMIGQNGVLVRVAAIESIGTKPGTASLDVNTAHNRYKFRFHNEVEREAAKRQLIDLIACT